MESTFKYALLLSMLLSAATSFADGQSCEEMFNDSGVAIQEAEQATADLITTNDHALPFSSEVNLADYKGQAFLETIRTQIKPNLDQFVKEGFVVGDSATVVAALDHVSPKVKMQALKAAGSVDNLKALADALKGQKVSFKDLPAKITATGIKISDKYGLTTFLALASGGGVVLRLCDGVCAFNVNYGDGTQDKDAQTGRSFAQGPSQAADDASDKSLLLATQAFVRSPDADIEAFYEALLNIILNSDPSGVSKLSAQGQNLMSTVIAIYVAEADRHLMSNMTTHSWETIELQTVLLAPLIAQLKEVMVMYQGKLVNTFPKQTPGGQAPGPMIPADYSAYWQFSKTSNQSGINEAKPSILLLGADISNFSGTANASAVASLDKLIGTAPGSNLFNSLVTLASSKSTPKVIPNAAQIAKEFASYLVWVANNGQNIVNDILSKQK